MISVAVTFSYYPSYLTEAILLMLRTLPAIFSSFIPLPSSFCNAVPSVPRERPFGNDMAGVVIILLAERREDLNGAAGKRVTWTWPAG